MTERRDHYSYSVYAQPDTARRFDQTRFGGPVGQLVGAREAEAIARFAGAIAGCTVLDVGTVPDESPCFWRRPVHPSPVWTPQRKC